MIRENQTYRIMKDKAFFYFIFFLCFLALIPLLSLIFKLVKNGVQYLIKPGFFFNSEPAQMDIFLAELAGESIPDGISNGMMGSVYILLIALVISIPIGVMSGVFFYSKKKHSFIRTFLYANNIILGIPAIITGMIVYLWIVRSLHSYSALAGGMAIAIIIFPYISRSTFQSLTKLPIGLEESSIALGADYSQTIFKIMIPSTGKEIGGYILHAASRGLGKTAPLVFTTLGAPTINWHLNKPTSSFSLQIWTFFSNPYMIHFMWSTALLLFLVILLLHVGAKLLVGDKKIYNNG